MKLFQSLKCQSGTISLHVNHVFETEQWKPRKSYGPKKKIDRRKKMKVGARKTQATILYTSYTRQTGKKACVISSSGFLGRIFLPLLSCLCENSACVRSCAYVCVWATQMGGENSLLQRKEGEKKRERFKYKLIETAGCVILHVIDTAGAFSVLPHIYV